MAIQKITGEDIKTQIHAVFKEQGGSRKGRKATMEKVAQIAEEVLSNLNAANQVVYEIEDNLDAFIDDLNKNNEEMENYTATIDENENEIDTWNDEIAELEAKREDGTIDESEEELLEELYANVEGATEENTEINGKITTLQSTVEGIRNQFVTSSNEVQEVVDAMEGYQDAGAEIRDAAETYGNKDADNMDKRIDRNKESWWRWIGIGRGDNCDKFNDYIARANLTQDIDGDDDLKNAYFDTVDNTFVSEYDVVTKRNGNKLKGTKFTKNTFKAYSYGQTIEEAAPIVKDKAEKVKNKDLPE
ncbi:hypothetical protein IKB17_04790 [bacterium]|nr:hypothetical protein [bacterium]